MSHDQDRQNELERQLTRALKEQPLRRAPGTLQQRVLTQIEAGTATARWRRGFAHWPVAARVAFLAASVGVVKLALMMGMWLSTPLGPTGLSFNLPSQVAWLQTLAIAIGSVMRTVPSLWIHAGVLILLVMYAALFGIGASAYRTVRAAHQ
jgi:hypothetical protein